MSKCVAVCTGYVVTEHEGNVDIEQNKNNKTLFRWSSINKFAT